MYVTPESYPSGSNIDLYVGSVDYRVTPEFDPRKALDVTELVLREEGGLVPLYEFALDQFKQMGKEAKLVSGSLMFNHHQAERPALWGNTLWAVLSHTRRYPGGLVEGIQDVFRVEQVYEHSQSEAPDPMVHEEVPFTARRMVLVQREVATYDGADIASIVNQTAATPPPPPSLTVETFGRVLAVVDSDTLVVQPAAGGDPIDVRLITPDAPEIPKPTQADARPNDPGVWRTPANQGMTEPQMFAHLYAWAVYATNRVRQILTPSAPRLSLDGATGTMGSASASEAKRHWVEDGATVRLVQDPTVNPTDDYNRKLLKVYHGGFGQNGSQGELGEWLIRSGVATVFASTFVDDRGAGQYDRLRRYQDEAREARRGAWGGSPPPALGA